ncbi:MAG: isoleucine--tRNA ligase [Alphaproteobacteria bacterium]
MSTTKDRTAAPDYRDTVFLPATEFPMRAELPRREPLLLERWAKQDLWGQIRADSHGRETFILHDGPPYANGHLHIGTALNKILKDVVSRSQQMLGKDSNYVPGWDCHGLPIEWKVEERYRAEGRDKDAVPVNEFRRECREFANHWLNVQRDEFKRLGTAGDWDNRYATMDFASEAQIARELMKFAASGQLYRGSKPVMWSVVEKTALAEAEVEYHDYRSDTVWVKFPVTVPPEHHPSAALVDGAAVVIWTTTPWTIPGNRAISFSSRIAYGLYEVTDAPADNWVKPGDRLVLADSLAADMFAQARIAADGYLRRGTVDPTGLTCRHPLHAIGYDFVVPLLDGEHVTEEAGTGFVHTAPGHGTDDFEIWSASEAALKGRGIETRIPFTVDGDGRFTAEAPGFEGKRVLTEAGDKGDANQAVIDALLAAGMLAARGRLDHQYPHSWRSKKPVIFRNTPQWFISMGDKRGPDGLRGKALKAIDETAFYPPRGQNRLRGMIEQRPDWVISRQRAWGVPITVFVNTATGALLQDPAVNERIATAFEAEGADAWFADGAKSRFLGNTYDSDDWEKVDDILDVWFESGCTHAFVLEKRPDLKWPASLYLEGSDQHRGWFHSSLLESCGTRGRAPYDAVLTHGFVMAEDGRKMSKSLGNQVFPEEVIGEYGADILRLWVVGSDYSDDLRIGPEIIKRHVDLYRRIRNTYRYLLGNLAGFSPAERVAPEAMPELERWVLHRLSELDGVMQTTTAGFDFHSQFTELHNFCTSDLSAFYFDIRKDALYCERPDSPVRRAARTTLDILFQALATWLAPVLVFTAEEAWLTRHGEQADSVHRQLFARAPADWADPALDAKWSRIRALRRAITGALEIARNEKRIGSSLQAHPVVYAPYAYHEALQGLDLAEIGITSAADLVDATPPEDAFRLPDLPDVGVVVGMAAGEKCARCYRVLLEVGSDPNAPQTCVRCADAVHAARSAAA